jgi:hypothetical protein
MFQNLFNLSFLLSIEYKVFYHKKFQVRSLCSRKINLSTINLLKNGTIVAQTCLIDVLDHLSNIRSNSVTNISGSVIPSRTITEEPTITL